MRILNVIQCTQSGGMEQANLDRLVGLKAAGHDVELISLNPVGSLGPKLAENRIPAAGLRYMGPWGLRSLPLVRKTLAERRSDALIMTGHNLMAMMALGRVCRGRRLLAIHFHHRGVKPDKQWRLIYRLALMRFQAITFASDFIRAEAEAILPAIAAISHTVRDPLALPEPADATERAAARRVLGLAADDRVVGNAGWMVPRKRFDVFLRVAARVAAAEPRAIFLLAGEGDEKENLRALAARLGIAERVRWLGWVDDLTPFYRSLDVLLFNSDWDAMGRTPLEAIGHGTPVVASLLNGGLGELLGGPGGGMVLDRHDEEHLAAMILDALKDPAAARAGARAARADLVETTAIDRHVAAIMTLLRLES